MAENACENCNRSEKILMDWNCLDAIYTLSVRQAVVKTTAASASFKDRIPTEDVEFPIKASDHPSTNRSRLLPPTG